MYVPSVQKMFIHADCMFMSDLSLNRSSISIVVSEQRYKLSIWAHSSFSTTERVIALYNRKKAGVMYLTLTTQTKKNCLTNIACNGHNMKNRIR